MTTNAGKGVGEGELLLTAGGNVSLWGLVEISMKIPQKIWKLW